MEKTLNWKTEELSKKNDWFALLKKKVYWRQRFTPLAVCAVLVVVGVLINYAWIVPVLKFSPKPELNDETIFKKVIRLEEILNNMTTHISELVDRDVQLTARVSQLEDNNMEQKAKISKLEEANRQQKERITQLEASNKQYQETVSGQVVQLKREGSDLKGDIEHVNISLAMKANQQEVMDMFTTLRETTVRRDKFQKLVTTVGSKADQSDLNDLENTVDETMATQSDLNSLSGHITLSQNQLRSSIRDNDQDIENLQNRIDSVEVDIKKLQKCTDWQFWC